MNINCKIQDPQPPRSYTDDEWIKDALVVHMLQGGIYWLNWLKMH